jgi:hypothetical protein
MSRKKIEFGVRILTPENRTPFMIDFMRYQALTSMGWTRVSRLRMGSAVDVQKRFPPLG